MRERLLPKIRGQHFVRTYYDDLVPKTPKGICPRCAKRPKEPGLICCSKCLSGKVSPEGQLLMDVADRFHRRAAEDVSRAIQKALNVGSPRRGKA